MNVYRYTRFSLVYVFLIPLILAAQIPNAGFEMWSGGNPNDWLTSNVPGVAAPVTQSGSSHSGSSAVRGEVLFLFESVYPPYLFAGGDGSGITITQRHAELTGYYQLFPQGNEVLYVTTVMYDNVSPIGAGEISLPAAGSYSQFSVPIEYFSSATPSRFWVQIVLIDTVNDLPTVGSVFLLDDLALSAPTSISGDEQVIVPQEYSLEQNYPNPFNPSTTIAYTLTQGGAVKLDVYSPSGQHIKTLFHGIQNAGRHVAQWQPTNLASGIYIYRLATNSKIITKKMLFMK
jgi:hypothetical protein